MTAASELVDHVAGLLESAIAECAHPERIQALREVHTIAVRVRQKDNRTRRLHSKTATPEHVARERRRSTNKRTRRNNETIDVATRRKQEWTDREIAVLERTELSNQQCVQLLGRTLRGVARKRERLGIRRTEALSS